MHKKLEAELIHLAHQILKIDDSTSIGSLRDKARDIYENLSVLSFIDDYFVETPSVTGDKNDFLDNLNKLNVLDKKQVVKEEVKIERTPIIEKPVEKVVEPISVIEKPVKVVPEITEPVIQKSEKENTEQLIKQTLSTIKTEAKELATNIQEKPQPTPKVEEISALDEEMKHSISADVAANMFEKLETKPKEIIPEPKAETPIKVETPAPIEKPIEVEKPKVNIATKQEIPTPKTETTTTSLNDRIFNKKIQVGLNDRIAFVKHLFNFSQEDFNRVLSQLNTFGSEQECKDFIKNQVSLDYNWADKVEYEERLITLIERKFK